MPEDLPNKKDYMNYTGATVLGDDTDELLILDEKLNITVFRFHWHQRDGYPRDPKSVVETHKLFTAKKAAI